MPAAGLLILRIVLAAVLVAHGTHDLFGVFETPAIGHGGLSAHAAYMASIGLSPAFLLAAADGVIQLAGGLLLLIGFLTRWVTLLVGAFKVVLLWMDAWQWGFFLNWTAQPGHGQGMEFLLLVLAALACLFFTGAGEWSIDGVRHREAAIRAAGRARLRAK